MSHFSGPDIEVSFPQFKKNTSSLNLLVDNLRKKSSKITMVEGHTGETVTSENLLQKGVSIAAGLSSAGVSEGDYIIICCDKSITAYSILLGVIFTGATAVLYPIPHIDILHDLTKGFPIKAVFTDNYLLDKFKKPLALLKTRPLIIATTDAQNKVMATLTASKERFELFQVRDPSTHIPVIFFSSGTTGDPKGILVRDTYLQLCGFFFNLEVDSLQIASPMYWMSSFWAFVSSVFNNYKVIWSNSSVPKDNLSFLQKYKVEGWYTGTGSMSQYINEPTLNRFDLSALKEVLVGGEYVVSSILNKFTSKVLAGRIVPTSVYGSTEGGITAMLRLSQTNGQFTIDSCGHLFPGTEAKILDDEGSLVPVGSLGEIWLKTPVLTPGYWGLPNVNKSSFDSNGFLRTGDAGLFNKGGNIQIRGRVEDLINYRGKKTSPIEVEDILMSHEAILEAAVVSKAHHKDILEPIAYVVLNKGCDATEDDIMNFVSRKVEERMNVGGVLFVNHLPRTIIGKVQRKLLREMV